MTTVPTVDAAGQRTARAHRHDGRHRRIRALVIGSVIIALTACTGSPDQTGSNSVPDSGAPGTTTIAVSGSPVESDGTAETAAELTSTLSPTPTTQPGVLTGPGIDDTYITLGSLVDPDADRGFQQGLGLWAGSINAAGGICGRWVQISTGESADLTENYRSLGASVLGFATSSATADQAHSLSSLLTSDQIPALTVGGTSADLLAVSPVVVGPTDDILAINALDYLVNSGTVTAGDSVGVVLDGSAGSADALKGLTWQAELTGVDLKTTTDADTAVEQFGELPAVLVFGTPETTAALVRDLPLTTKVMTTIAGYRADQISAADARHLEVVLATPAYDSDHPGATAVATAFGAAGMTDPGPLLFAGYAVGATWQRLLLQACDEGELTRDAVTAAMLTIGPASVDGMFAGSDPAQVVESNLPASRSASIAQADPQAPTGLTQLAGLFAAEGIDDYVP